MSKKVLYLSYDGLTDHLGQSQILPYVKGLSKIGYQFTILSCDKRDKYKKLKDHIQELCDEDNIEWVSIPFTTRPPILSKFLDRRRFRRKVLQLHHKNNYDLVHCRSYVPAEVGLMMKQKYSVKFLFDMRGFWADERVEGGNWNTNYPFYNYLFKYFKRKEKIFLENADCTICLTNAAKNEIHSWSHLANNPVPIATIPCCVDVSHFNPDNIKNEEKENLKRELKINKEDFIVSYLGSIGTWYMLNEMLDFFKIFLETSPHAKLLFITGDDEKKIRNVANKKQIPQEKIIIRSGNRIEVPLFLSLSELSIYFIRPTYSKIASSPTKQGEIMAMGIPSISNQGIGDIAEISIKYNCGTFINDFTNEEYKQAISSISKINIREIRTGAVSFYNLQNGIELYNKVYSEMFSLNNRRF